MTPKGTAPAASDVHAAGVRERLALAGSFTGAARRYWTDVFPETRRELARWRERAATIPDPVLRTLALEGQHKRSNVEGAAAFAAFPPRAHRGAVVRALVAFQSAYNYLDALAEQPYADPVAGARGLHQALLDALDPHAPVGVGSPGGRQPDYYADYPQHEDGGYLAALVRDCRAALATLPSYAAVAAAARVATERIVEFQSLNLSRTQGGHDAFEVWARANTPAGADLRWWEAAAAGGSSLGVYALIAAAADPFVRAQEIGAIERAYFPWIGGLHSLLDHLVDRGEDAASGQRNLLDYYSSPAEATTRLHELARGAASAARGLPESRTHTILLAGMAASYLSEPGAAAPDAEPIAGGVRAAIGPLMGPALLVFKARRMADGLADAAGILGRGGQTAEEERGSRIALGVGR